MRRTGRTLVTLTIIGGAWLSSGPARADVLTVDKAVQLALRQGSQSIQADASVLDGKSRLWSAYSGVLPRVSASLSRSESWVTHGKSSRLLFLPIGVGKADSAVNSRSNTDAETHGTTPTISGSWDLLNLSSLTGLSSARSGYRGAQLQRSSTRNDVAFNARRQFYEVVKAVKLAQVSDGALQLSRDNERRVRALFEVGSVSRSDLLKAQVQTSQSQLDSLTKHHNVTVQRSTLAALIGARESEMAEVDTVLTAESHDYDEAALLAEAAKARPDLMAAEAGLRAAKSALNSARFLRLPYVSLQGSADLNTSSHTTSTLNDRVPFTTLPSSSSTDRLIQGSLSLNWNLFDGFLTDSRIATARANLLRAQENRDALQRNLASDVHQAWLSYREIIVGYEVAQRTLESATESLKLTQQKYNVGSATILELVDAQVQLQRAQSDGVSALAGIRQAEAQLNRALGRGE